MKTTNERKDNLKERAIRKVGDQLERMAITRTCLTILLYEPKLSREMIMEMKDI